MRDIEWCIEQCHTLSLREYVDHFSIDDIQHANNRYKDILSSKAFMKACPNAVKLQRDFEEWKGSSAETLFWTERTLDTTRILAKRRLQTDGIETALQYGLQGGESLRQQGESSM